MRTTNLRTIAGYRTISLEATYVLARLPPVHLLAQMRKRVFHRIVDLKRENLATPQALREINEEESLLTRRQWAIYLKRPGVSGARVLDAVLPNLEDWLDRGHGWMNFHLTQIITGHGCFASYLCRIQKRPVDVCEHCDAGVTDTADHTLSVCSAWTDEREALTKVIGTDLTLGSVIQKISIDREAWAAMIKYATIVMKTKEDREREREREGFDDPDGRVLVPPLPNPDSEGTSDKGNT